MITQQRPVIWIGEPEGFSTLAKRRMEEHATVIYKKVSIDQLKDVFSNCDVFLFRLGLKIESKDLSKNQRCKIIATAVTGLDHIDISACTENNIRLISLKGEIEFLKDIHATAEFTITLLLSLIRNVVPSANRVSQNQFERDAFRGYELYQKTIGIIGFGRLGKIVSTYAKSFGMKVLIHEKDKDKIVNEDGLEFVELNKLIKNSDYISLHIDASEENYHLVDNQFLSQMKETAYLINTSRGSLIDEAALVSALEKGQISGAALDVVQGEPNVDFKSPLFTYSKSHSNLLITPHIGGNTFESFEKTECFIADKIIQQLTHA